MAKRLNRERLWRLYQRTQDPALYERLIGACRPLISSVVRRIAPNVSTQASHDDLVSYAYDGVVNAIVTWRPDDDNCSFDRWVKKRIEWAIYDGLRAMETWMPRSLWQRDRKAEDAASTLRKKLGRSPTRQEIVDALGWSVHYYDQHLVYMRRSNICSFDEVIEADGFDEDRTLLELTADSRSLDPAVVVIRKQLAYGVADALAQLSAAQHVSIVCYYEHELFQHEIGKLLGVSTSRASQFLRDARYYVSLSLKDPEAKDRIAQAWSLTRRNLGS